MNQKTYKIWMLLLEHSGEWVDIDRIAYEMDLTRRQMHALLPKFPDPPVERCGGDGTAVRLRVRGSPEYLRRLRTAVTMDRYAITPEMVDTLYGTLSAVGWLALKDLSSDTGFTMTQLVKTLEFMQGVEVRTINGTPMYRKAVTTDV